MASISEFKAQLLGGGARANQFRVDLSFPGFVAAGAVAGFRAQFMCKAASMPAATIENVPVQYRGRQINLAGERTFQPWTVTIYNDTNFDIRNAMERWSNGIQNLIGTDGRTNPRDYQADLEVHQLDRNSAVLKSYKFIDAYPIDISAITLDFDQANTVEQFDVTFQYNYWYSGTSIQ